MKSYERKKNSKNTKVYFESALHCWHGAALKTVLYTQQDSRGVTNPSCVSSCQLGITPWLGMRNHSRWVSAGTPIWLGPVQTLCALSWCLGVQLCISPDVSGRHCCLGVLSSLWVLQSFPFLFQVPSAPGENPV